MIIACDLDGTLTDHDGVISAQNARSLLWARERGVICVLATSRPSRCLDLPKRQLALFDCVITCDGAERAFPDPAGVWLPMAPGDIDRAGIALQDAGVSGAYAVEFGTGLGHEKGFAGWPATDRGSPFRIGRLEALCRLAPVARVYFRPDASATWGAAADALTTAAGVGITVSEQTEGRGLVQFTHRRATKGEALRTWLDDTRHKGPLIAFGDQLNDLSLLDLADEAFAVGDAHPALLRRYSHLPNDDGSAVARAIRRVASRRPTTTMS